MSEQIWRGKLLGIIGGGNMAEALVRGVITAGLVAAYRVIAYDPLPARRQVFADLGCLAAESVRDTLNADVILLATKPQNLREAVGGLSGAIRPGTLFISIAAGIGTQAIEKLLPSGTRVIRVMPNTPLLVGQGMSALARGSAAGQEDMELALELFACAGKAVEVRENLLDSVTALSGSGPAYFFRFAEALIAGGVALGMSPSLSKELTIAMLKGSAEMLERYQDPALLRERVTSPGGTTAAALKVFEDRDFAAMIAEALSAASRRSVELGQQ